jgi:hypothetical protein
VTRFVFAGASIVFTALIVSSCAASSPDPKRAAADPIASEWFDAVTATCARIASCAHPHDTPKYREPSACVDYWMAHVKRHDDPRNVCIMHAKTCDSVDECLHEPSDARAIAYCRAHPQSTGTCDEDRLIACASDDPDESSAVDCAALAAKCSQRDEPGGLITRTCVSTTRCPANAPETRCEDARSDDTKESSAILTCREGAIGRVACAEGTRCTEHREDNGDISAGCEPVFGHAHCDQVGARYCAGDRLVECQAHGHFGTPTVSDCASFGLVCADEGKASHCVAKGPSHCEPHAPKCAGAALTFCAAGREVHIDCARLGLGPCDPDAHGVEAACSVAP